MHFFPNTMNNFALFLTKVENLLVNYEDKFNKNNYYGEKSRNKTKLISR